MARQLASARIQPYGEDVEEMQHFPGQQQKTCNDNQHGQHFANSHPTAAARGLQAARDQGQNVKGGKAEHQHPQNVVELAAFIGELPGTKQEKHSHLPHLRDRRREKR